jgi:uncharacterized protein YbjT (DUF2867 family)
MTNQLVLVTGAAGGQQGQTGRHVSEMLLARGAPVRAFVHRIDERSDRLRALGAELVEGDFLYPVQDGLLDATATMAVAARNAGVSRLVDLVMLRSSADAPTPRMRQNYLSEQVFEWAGIAAAHVRAAVFYENLRALVRLSLSTQDAIRLPFGSDSTVIPLVSAEDVARVAVGLLTSRTAPAGAGYRVIGAVLTLRDIIATFGAVLGRDVRYKAVSDEEWRRGALARASIRMRSSILWRFFRTAGLDPESGGYAITDTIEIREAENVRGFRAPGAQRLDGASGPGSGLKRRKLSASEEPCIDRCP